MSPRMIVALRFIGLGWYIATCILLGTLAGVWADRWLQKAPLFILIGLTVGLIAAFIGVYKMVMTVLKEEG